MRNPRLAEVEYKIKMDRERTIDYCRHGTHHIGAGRDCAHLAPLYKQHSLGTTNDSKSTSSHQTVNHSLAAPKRKGCPVFLSTAFMVYSLVISSAATGRAEEIAASKLRQFLSTRPLPPESINVASGQPEEPRGQMLALTMRQAGEHEREAANMLHSSASRSSNTEDSVIGSARATGPVNALAGAQHQPSSGLQIVRLFAPEAVQNGTQNVTIDCMFRFDEKLDQRLTIKWFFNEEVEPIYQWIPELNKRVYSDKYEHFLDKSYQVNEDVDFMLQSYKWLVESGTPGSAAPPLLLPSEPANQLHSTNNNNNDNVDQANIEATNQQVNRKLLANRLNRLAKLGSEHSRQLLASLRSSLAMQNGDFSRFRALRLIMPTSELNGRFTCSISSLEGDDLQSTRLVVFEPAKKLEFGVTRVASSQTLFNLSCSASQVFPRPTLSLLRHNPATPTSGAASGKAQVTDGKQLEPLGGVQTQLVVSSGRASARLQEEASWPRALLTEGEGRRLGGRRDEEELVWSNEIAARRQGAPPSAIDPEPGDLETAPSEGGQAPFKAAHNSRLHYDISAWTLVEESSLSGAQATQFECLLTVDAAPNYEQRRTFFLQKGWHSNQSPTLALARNSMLVGLLGAFAALLCLLVALVSAGLISRMLRKHPLNGPRRRAKVADSAQVIGVARSGSRRSDGNKQLSRADERGGVEEEEEEEERVTESACSGTSTTNVSSPRAQFSAASAPINRPGSDYNEFGLVDSAAGAQPVTPARQKQHPIDYSDGLYRVPASLSRQTQQQMPSDGQMPSYDNPGFNDNNRFVIGAGRWAADYAQHVAMGLQQQQKQDVAQHHNGWTRPRNYSPVPAPAAAQYHGQQQRPTKMGTNLQTPIGAHHQATISVNGKQLYC